MGFNPISTTDGSDWHAKMREIIIDDAVANTFLGDMMAVAGVVVPASSDGRAESMILGTAGVYVVNSSTALAGAVVSFTPDFTDEGSLIRNFHQTGADQLAKLVYGTDVIYESTDFDGSLALASINTNRNIDTSVAGDTGNGISGMQIGAASNGADGQLRVLGFSRQEGDLTAAPAIGTTGSKWRVRLNNSPDDHAQVGVS